MLSMWYIDYFNSSWNLCKFIPKILYGLVSLHAYQLGREEIYHTKWLTLFTTTVGKCNVSMGPPLPLPNICHKIGYFANSFMIFTFSASHQKYYFKGLIEEGSNRASPTIKGRSSIPTHTFNFCDTWEENETQTHVTQIYLAPAHTGGVMGVLRSVVRHSGLCHVTWRCDIIRSRLAQSLW